MKKTCCFQLEVIPADGAPYGLALIQLMTNGARMENGSRRAVARIWGAPLESVLDQVLEALRKSGFRASDLRPGRKCPLDLPEEVGVRLGLLFLAIKPLRRLDRIITISQTVRHMEAEEAYYWFSKCSRPDLSRRACRAMRILMAER
jgi:hypothetical protein